MLLLSSAAFGFYIKGMLSRLTSLEKAREEFCETVGTLVTKVDLEAALDKFELRLQGSLSSTYLSRAEYERRNSDMSERLTGLTQRLERHEMWHQEKRFRDPN